MADQMERLLERVANELLVPQVMPAPVVNGFYQVLKRRFLPILEAGQAMRKHAPLVLEGNQNFYKAEAAWDRALEQAAGGSAAGSQK